MGNVAPEGGLISMSPFSKTKLWCPTPLAYKVGSQPLIIKERFAPNRHPFDFYQSQTYVGSPPDRRRRSRAPTAIGRVNDVQLPAGVFDRLWCFVDVRVANRAFPTFARLRNDVPRAGDGGRVGHPSDIDVLFDVGVPRPAGPNKPPLIVKLDLLRKS